MADTHVPYLRFLFRLCRTLIGIVWFLLKLIFSILWHPITLVLFTVLMNLTVFTSGNLPTISFSPENFSGSDLIGLGMILTMFALYGLGVGMYIVGRVMRRGAAYLLLVSFMTAVVTLLFLVQYFESGSHAYLLMMNLMLLLSISVGTVIDTVLSYLLSPKPGRLFPSARIDIRGDIRAVQNIFRWMSAHKLVVTVIVMQLGFNAFLMYRLADMESRIGGSLFTMCSADKTIQTAKASIVRIASDDGEGTGMVLREDGYILTNAHVIAEDPAPKIIFSDYSFKPSSVIYRDTEKDIAVVKVDGTGYTPLKFADPKGMPARSALYSAGYPMGTALRGDATVAKFIFTGVRSIKDVPTEMVQLEGVGTGGSSGSPVMTSCGEVVGMFSATAEGISLAISSKAIEEAIGFLSRDESQWPAPPVYSVEPDKSAEEAVKAYYAFIKMRDFKRAYLMLTAERVKDNPLDNWVKGYDKTLDVTLVSIKKDDIQPTPVPKKVAETSGISAIERYRVKIRSLDLEGQDVVMRYFEGPWIVVYDGEFWHLSDSNIKPVPEPGWDWFW